METELDLAAARYKLIANLKDFNSDTLTECRQLVQRAVKVARSGKFDDAKLLKAADYLSVRYELVNKTTKDLNILAQIERMSNDLGEIYKENKS